jgi:hypothetical protein
MTFARILTATAALAFAVALSPAPKLQAAPLTGSIAQPMSAVTPIAAKGKEHKAHHAHMRKHHRRHHAHSKRGCRGTYMYYSRKAHHCMDARKK